MHPRDQPALSLHPHDGSRPQPAKTRLLTISNAHKNVHLRRLHESRVTNVGVMPGVEFEPPPALVTDLRRLRATAALWPILDGQTLSQHILPPVATRMPQSGETLLPSTFPGIAQA